MIDKHITSDLLRNHEATNFGRIDNPETIYSRALNEIERLKAIILDRNEAIEVFQDIVETNKDKIEAMSYALTSVGQTLVTISAHVVNCVNTIEEARKKR